MEADNAAMAARRFAPGPRIGGTRAKYLLFAAIGTMYLYVLATTERFLVDPGDPNWAHIESFKWWLLPHGMAAVFPLFLGPLQFSDRLRRKFVGLHKVLGYLYIGGVLIGAPLGIYIQWFEERMGASRNFTIAAGADATLWLFATAMALACIWQKKVQLHRQWMTRSFACALIFLEVRVIAVLFQVPLPYIEIVVWGCVAAAFPLADLVLYLEDALKQKPRVAGA